MSDGDSSSSPLHKPSRQRLYENDDDEDTSLPDGSPNTAGEQTAAAPKPTSPADPQPAAKPQPPTSPGSGTDLDTSSSSSSSSSSDSTSDSDKTPLKPLRQAPSDSPSPVQDTSLAFTAGTPNVEEELPQVDVSFEGGGTAQAPKEEPKEEKEVEENEEEKAVPKEEEGVPEEEHDDEPLTELEGASAKGDPPGADVSSDDEQGGPPEEPPKPQVAQEAKESPVQEELHTSHDTAAPVDKQVLPPAILASPLQSPDAKSSSSSSSSIPTSSEAPDHPSPQTTVPVSPEPEHKSKHDSEPKIEQNKEVSPPPVRTDTSFSVSPVTTIKHTPACSQSPEQHKVEIGVVAPPEVPAPSAGSTAGNVVAEKQEQPVQGAKEKVSPPGTKALSVKLTKAHSLRMADTKKKVQVKESEEQKVLEQAKSVQSRRVKSKSPSGSSPASSNPVPALQPQVLPQPPPPSLPKARYDKEAYEGPYVGGLQPSVPTRSKSTPQPKIRPESPNKRVITSPVRLPTPVSPAGRYTAHPSDIIEGGRRDIAARLKYKKDDQVHALEECIKQKEAARQERKNMLANLNNFLTVYAGESPLKESKRSQNTSRADVQDWERRRVVGKALFTRTSSQGSPSRGESPDTATGTGTGTVAGSPAREFPASITELRAESWRESIKRHKQMEEQKGLQGGNRLFQQGMELAREKKKWADNERSKSSTKRALESESNLTFTPALSTASRAIEAALRKNAPKDHKTRLVPDKQSAVHKKSHDTTQAFGRTTRAPEPAPVLNRSLSAPIPARVDKLARPKKTYLIEQVGHAFDELNGQWTREHPIDEKLLAKRNHDMKGRGVSQYLHGKSVEIHAEKAKVEKLQKQQSRSNSNVGKYISSSSRDMATKRRRERLEQLFYLLDVEGNGRVTQAEIEQADAALKSVRSRISDPREAAILQALTEAAEILSHSTTAEYTLETFIAALETKITKFGPMKFMQPDTREAKARPAPSFNPSISERSRRMATRQAQSEVVYNRLYDIAAEQQAKREEKYKEKMESEVVGLTFQPTINKARRKVVEAKMSDDVLAHIDDIVGEAAAWLKDVGHSPGKGSPRRGRGRSPGKGREASPVSVSPMTPGQDERSLHMTDLYTGMGSRNMRAKSLGEREMRPSAVQRQGQIVQFHDPMAMYMISPTRSPSVSPQQQVAQVGYACAPPMHQLPVYEPMVYPYALPQQPLVTEPPPPAKPKRVKRAQPPAQTQISLSSLHTASVAELARAGKLLMQQQLEKHRSQSRHV